MNGVRRGRTFRETFGLGPLGKVLDLVEFDGLETEAALARWRGGPSRDLHPALVRWTEHAVRQYLDARTNEMNAGPVLQPVSRTWARLLNRPLDGLSDPHEEIVHGRRYAGGRVRALCLTRYGGVEGRPRDEAEIALAAAVLAAGGPVLNRPWSTGPLLIGRYERPERVRVIEIGCLDGSSNVLFDDTAEVAFEAYEEHALDRVRMAPQGRRR